MKYIFLDWGYTLVTKFVDVDEQIDQLLAPYDICFKQLFSKWKNYHILASLGRINQEEKYQQLSMLTGMPTSVFAQINQLLLDSHIIDDKTKELLKRLVAKDYVLGIISNNVQEEVKYIFKREDLIAAKGLGIQTVWFDQPIENQWKKKETLTFPVDDIIHSLEEIEELVLS